MRGIFWHYDIFLSHKFYVSGGRRGGGTLDLHTPV